MSDLTGHFEELIRRASTLLPADVRGAMEAAAAREGEGAAPGAMLRLMLENADEARRALRPICQDTGALLFFVHYGPEYTMSQIREAATAAARSATAKTLLRPNAVHPLTGKNSGDNTGEGAPYFHFEQEDEPGLRVKLLLKGGGSENVGAQYKLPDDRLKAGRDLEGVRKCVLDAVFQAQGKGCAPGIIAVGLGGDRGAGYVCSKEQYLRPLGDVNPDPKLAALEKRLTEELNELGIGPMGCGGKTTVLGVKIGYRHRLPACYFVSVSYLCWAARKASMTIVDGEVSYA